MTPTLGNVYYPFSCPRCEGEHERGEISFEDFTHPPVQVGAVQYVAWATCPTVEEPVLIFQFDPEMAVAGA